MENRIDVNPNNAFVFKEMLKMKRRQMSPGNRARSRNTRISAIWLYPLAQEAVYRKYLFDLMDVYKNQATPIVRNNIERWTEEARSDSWPDWDDPVRADDFTSEFQRLIDELERTQSDMFNENGAGVRDNKGNFFNRTTILATLGTIGWNVSNHNKRQEQKFTKILLGDQPFTPAEPWLEDVVQSWGRENFSLIKKLSEEHITELNRIVSSGVMDGQTWDSIMKDVRKMNKNLSRNRTRLLARDQVGKLNGRFTKRRNQEAGISLYQWWTALDERVRGSHRALHGKICRWDDDSVYADSIEDARAGNWKSRSGLTATTVSQTGKSTTSTAYIGTPGQDIQCRCTSTPVYIDVVEEADEELAQEAV